MLSSEGDDVSTECLRSPWNPETPCECLFVASVELRLGSYDWWLCLQIKCSPSHTCMECLIGKFHEANFSSSGNWYFVSWSTQLCLVHWLEESESAILVELIAASRHKWTFRYAIWAQQTLTVMWFLLKKGGMLNGLCSGHKGWSALNSLWLQKFPD